MTTGVQFTGSLTANQTQRWFTFNWQPAQHVVWYMMPTTPETTGAEAQLDRGGGTAPAPQPSPTG